MITNWWDPASAAIEALWNPAPRGLSRAISLVNAAVVLEGGVASSLRFRSRVLSIDDPPARGDAVIDLEGAFVLPGLINAHDHLELNHFGALKARERYANAAEWIDDLRPVIRTDRHVRRNVAYPLRDRLFIGGLKNLLSGATTVAHHNPLYHGIWRAVPVRVVRRFGWAHSLWMEKQPVGANGEPGGDVRERWRRTPGNRPFIVHAAEGIDGRAAEEIERLQALGCISPNTVLVHGVALTAAAWQGVVGRGASLVWCPRSNDFLFGRTAPVRALLDAAPASRGRICLGTDSRITGSRDLLDELRHAHAVGAVGADELLHMVTCAPAAALRLSGAGTLRRGGPADLIVIPRLAASATAALVTAHRRNVQLVVVGGRPLFGEQRFQAAFDARRVGTAAIRVDGADRVAEARLAARIRSCAIQEPGVACA
jgi:cytosine/adenosine deaminase-related metal-dependent hydrolase